MKKLIKKKSCFLKSFKTKSYMNVYTILSISFIIGVFGFENNVSLKNEFKIDNNDPKKCSFSSSYGSYDINSARGLVDYKFEFTNYIYKANFCGSLVEPCGQSQTPASIHDQSGICFGALANSWDDYSVEYTDTTKTSIKIIFNQNGGHCANAFSGKNKLHYVLKCDNSVSSPFIEAIKRVNSCTFEYIFVGKTFCSISNNGLLGFSCKKLLSYIAISSSLYLLLIWYYNYKVFPEDGVIKAFPHRDFFFSLLENAGYGFKITLLSIKQLFIKKEEET